MSPETTATPTAPSTAKATFFVSADHRGFNQKQEIVKFLRAEGYNVEDLGPETLNENDDFNDAALKVCRKVLENSRENPQNARGVLVCGSAHGISIQSNRFKGIRAIAAYTPELAKIGRQHEDANVLCLSADFVEPAENLQNLKAFLTTEALKDERYLRRERRLDEEVD